MKIIKDEIMSYLQMHHLLMHSQHSIMLGKFASQTRLFSWTKGRKWKFFFILDFAKAFGKAKRLARKNQWSARWGLGYQRGHCWTHSYSRSLLTILMTRYEEDPLIFGTPVIWQISTGTVKTRTSAGFSSLHNFFEK